MIKVNTYKANLTKSYTNKLVLGYMYQFTSGGVSHTELVLHSSSDRQ